MGDRSGDIRSRHFHYNTKLSIMKRKERQDRKWSELNARTHPTSIEFKEWVIKIGKEYLEYKKNRSWYAKVVDFIFGPVDTLGENIVKEYGKHNIENS